jgi:hypothetical protein
MQDSLVAATRGSPHCRCVLSFLKQLCVQILLTFLPWGLAVWQLGVSIHSPAALIGGSTHWWQHSLVAALIGGSTHWWQDSLVAGLIGGSTHWWQDSLVAALIGGSCQGLTTLQVRCSPVEAVWCRCFALCCWRGTLWQLRADIQWLEALAYRCCLGLTTHAADAEWLSTGNSRGYGGA